MRGWEEDGWMSKALLCKGEELNLDSQVSTCLKRQRWLHMPAIVVPLWEMGHRGRRIS